jgi:hypothetical protein
METLLGKNGHKGGMKVATSRQHQEAHGIGQIEEQLKQQNQAAEAIQGLNETDQAIASASRRQDSELDEIIDPE